MRTEQGEESKVLDWKEKKMQQQESVLRCQGGCVAYGHMSHREGTTETKPPNEASVV